MLGPVSVVVGAVTAGAATAAPSDFAGAWPLAILVAGAGGSFCVNFVLSKWVVFAPEGERA